MSFYLKLTRRIAELCEYFGTQPVIAVGLEFDWKDATKNGWSGEEGVRKKWGQRTVDAVKSFISLRNLANWGCWFVSRSDGSGCFEEALRAYTAKIQCKGS